MPDSTDLDSIRERQHPRVAANLPVEVKAPGMIRQAVAEDISLAGLRVLGLRAPVGQSLIVALALPGDRRVQVVHLTELGQSLIERAFPAHAPRVTQLMAALTPAEQEDLGRLADKLGRAAAAG